VDPRKVWTASIFLAISEDSTMMVSDFGKIKVWSLPEGKLLNTLESVKGGIKGLAISHDGKMLVTYAYPADIKLWSLPSGTPMLKSVGRGPIGDNPAIHIESEGEILVATGDTSGIKLKSFHFDEIKKIPEKWTTALYISTDGKTMVSGHSDGGIRLWSLPEGKEIKSVDGGFGYDAVRHLHLSEDGTILASGIGYTKVALWSLPKAERLKNLKNSLDLGEALAIGPDNEILATAGSGTIKLWSLPDGEPIGCLYDPECSEEPQGPIRKMNGLACACDTVCTCDSVCICDSFGASCGGGRVGGGSHYWRSN
jgi:WD40 repeat protein